MRIIIIGVHMDNGYYIIDVHIDGYHYYRVAYEGWVCIVSHACLWRKWVSLLQLHTWMMGVILPLIVSTTNHIVFHLHPHSEAGTNIYKKSHPIRKELDAMDDPMEKHRRRGAHWTFNAQKFVSDVCKPC